jgi:hypothetical protein
VEDPKPATVEGIITLTIILVVEAKEAALT